MTGKAAAKSLIAFIFTCLFIGVSPSLPVGCWFADEISSSEFIPKNLHHRVQIWNTATSLVFDSVNVSEPLKLTNTQHCIEINPFHLFELVSDEKDYGRQKDSLPG